VSEISLWYAGACFVMFATGFAGGMLHRTFLRAIEIIE
jgi:hypothetical protein